MLLRSGGGARPLRRCFSRAAPHAFAKPSLSLLETFPAGAGRRLLLRARAACGLRGSGSAETAKSGRLPRRLVTDGFRGGARRRRRGGRCGGRGRQQLAGRAATERRRCGQTARLGACGGGRGQRPPCSRGAGGAQWGGSDWANELPTKTSLRFLLSDVK